MVVGPIIGLPTPGPLGLVLFAAGLALVLRNSPAARRHYVRYARRNPRVQRVMNFGLRRRRGRVAGALLAEEKRPPAAGPEAADPQSLAAIPKDGVAIVG